MAALGLVLLALLLAVPLPRVMARRTGFRVAPLAALAVWQAVSVAAVLAALLAAPVGIRLVTAEDESVVDHLPALVLALAVSGTMLAFLLLSAHRVGRRLRSVRREHRELVDLLATHGEGSLRVLEHPTPTAYCLPGLRQRVVLTRGTMQRLAPEELAAVVAHERAHLRARHDLVLEFFTVVHESVPGRLRSREALAEVRLLVEVLADRAAVRAVGQLAVARALVRLGEAGHPEASLGAGGSAGTAATRIALLDRTPSPALVAGMALFGTLVLAAPVLLTVLGWTG